MLCLGIESSCDETGLALVRDGQVIGASLASQADLHALFDGVVPEIASREHYHFIGALYDQLMRSSGVTLQDVDIIAVTQGPGLLGSLLVGVAFAKGLALGSGKPILGINHLHAHLLAVGLEQDILYPALGLLVSGGHTHLYRINAVDSFQILGRTLDDAAGEACDKFAKMLGLPYPGGSLLDQLACQGQADPTLFPRPYTKNENCDFSFSGLKTAALVFLEAHPELVNEGKRIRFEGSGIASQRFCNFCASYLLAIADTLRIKMQRALKNDFASLIVAGGVAANTQVRSAISELAIQSGKKLLLPSRSLCTDNGVMIAWLGYLLAQQGYRHNLSFSAIPRGQKLPSYLPPGKPWGITGTS